MNEIEYNGVKIPYTMQKSKIKNMYIHIKEGKVIEYVVLHEMCHIREMNHSKRFWDLVEENMNDYKIYKKKLKNE